MLFAVCGLHMREGLLNHDLTSRKATFVKETKTVQLYTIHALSDQSSTKPGLVFHPKGGSHTGGITVEVWDIPEENMVSLLKMVPSPLAVGTIHLEDNSTVQGFIAEGWAAESEASAIMELTTEDITRFGGWREWQAQRTAR